MTIVHHKYVDQGSTDWLKLRRGLLTASEMKLIITPTLKAASNDNERAHFYELLSQRITGQIDPAYVSDHMLRGQEDEIDAREKYDANYAPVTTVGFITNDRFGFKIGYSPDGLVGRPRQFGDRGQIEAKSRLSKYQVQTILEHIEAQTIPDEFVIQVQTGLLVSQRDWCDFITYSAGLPMATIRVYPDPIIHEAIVDAATAFEIRMAKAMLRFNDIMNSDARLLATERREEMEITL